MVKERLFENIKTTNTMTLINDLLTENRFWTFWSNDWSKKVHVFWGGKTKFSNVKNDIQKILGTDFMYERQVELKTPDIKYQ